MSTVVLVLKVLVLSILLWCLVVYPFLLAPRIFGRPDKKPFYAYYYAHRGLHDQNVKIPENSMAAFQRAVESGYGMELDVQLSKDGVPVVFHDDTLFRMCGQDGAISDYTFAQLQEFSLAGTEERIPSLEDVLKAVDGRTPLIMELKIPSADLTVCSKAAALLEGYRGLYCIESFNPLGLLWYRIYHRKVVRGQLSTAFMREKKKAGLAEYLMQNLLFNFVGRPDFIAYNCKYADMTGRRLCCNLYGAMSVGWTIESAEELERARKDFDLYIFEGFTPYP